MQKLGNARTLCQQHLTISPAAPAASAASAASSAPPPAAAPDLAPAAPGAADPAPKAVLATVVLPAISASGAAASSTLGATTGPAAAPVGATDTLLKTAPASAFATPLNPLGAPLATRMTPATLSAYQRISQASKPIVVLTGLGAAGGAVGAAATGAIAVAAGATIGAVFVGSAVVTGTLVYTVLTAAYSKVTGKQDLSTPVKTAIFAISVLAGAAASFAMGVAVLGLVTTPAGLILAATLLGVGLIITAYQGRQWHVAQQALAKSADASKLAGSTQTLPLPLLGAGTVDLSKSATT